MFIEDTPGYEELNFAEIKLSFFSSQIMSITQQVDVLNKLFGRKNLYFHLQTLAYMWNEYFLVVLFPFHCQVKDE
jgi:hypothetical protein